MEPVRDNKPCSKSHQIKPVYSDHLFNRTECVVSHSVLDKTGISLYSDNLFNMTRIIAIVSHRVPDKTGFTERMFSERSRNTFLHDIYT